MGDEVEEGDDILVVETDKASVEIPSPYSGEITGIEVEPGDLDSAST
ncbi:MAG: biotin/lipoyl-containing protein [Thermoplasmata archaeon]